LPILIKLFTFSWLQIEFEYSLYILNNSLLPHVCPENIFSQSVSCLLTLLILSFTEHKFLILMKSSVSVI
jgi:hypothetical protein